MRRRSPSATASDVQRCLAFARDNNIEVAARSGGHSYAGYSSCPGLVMDVCTMNTVSVGTAGQGLATVGAGTVLIDVYNQLAAQDRLLPGGSCPTVGHRRADPGRRHRRVRPGLRADLRSAARRSSRDGGRRPGTRADRDNDADLYWACRGGGGGNFGVVTSFGFRTHPIPTAITLFTLEWPWGAAGDVLNAWLGCIPSAPDELWANCQLYSSGTVGSGLVKVTGVFVGSVSACTADSESPHRCHLRCHDLSLRRTGGLLDGHND